MALATLKARMLQQIKPSRDEEAHTKTFVDNLVRVAKVISGLECTVCGSIGKFTWLKGDHDVDLFMLFPKDTTREELESRGLDAGKQIVAGLRGDYVIKYAEHPYVHGTIEGYRVDIVPCYRIAKGENILSAVDRSPLHLQHVLAALDPGLRDEVRLLKQFCKGIGVYGSDARTQGFSGYICELLVIEYGTFENVLSRAAKWPVPKRIPANATFDAPLVIVDPMDGKRNAAANVSAENAIRFVAKARSFIEKPDERYFKPSPEKPLSPQDAKQLKDRRTKFVALTFRKPDLIDDVLVPQLRRALFRIKNLLEYHEFIVLRGYEHVGTDAVLCFELETWALPDVKKMVGPPVTSTTHTKEFLGKYAAEPFGPSVEDGRWVADRKREFTEAAALLRHFAAQDAVTLKEQGIPEQLAYELGRGRVLDHDAFWERVERDETFSALLRKKYFERLV